MKPIPTYADLPSPARILATVFGGVTLFVLFRVFLGQGDMPMLLPLLTAAGSILTLFALGQQRDPCQSFMRVGFHLGTFAFFLLFPLMEPADVGPTVSNDVRWVVGLGLLLSVVGFELAYWVSRLTTRRPLIPATMFVLSEQQQRLLIVLVYFGIFAWFLNILDTAISGGVSVIDVLMTMRAEVEGADREAQAFLGGPLVIVSRLLEGGVILAATAASMLLTIGGRRSRFAGAVYWATLVLAAAAGFQSGSRAIFFYAICPLVATCWLFLSGSPKRRSMRWMWVSVAFVMLLVAWGAMTALRGADVRKYERGFEAMVPTIHARGTLDIYSDMAVVIQSFPELIPYQTGQSLVPLVLGWVPRAVWPDKPYPFTLFMNFLNGETLEHRAMSIAVGLVGEGYGNFGLFGVFLWAVLMGIACRRGDDYVGGFHLAHPLRLQLAAMVGIWSALIVRGGVPEMFYMGLSLILMPWILARYISRAETATAGVDASAPVMMPGVARLARRSA